MVFAIATVSATAHADSRTTAAYDGATLYLRATVAVNEGNYNTALSLLQRAATLPGQHNTPTKLLYADTLYRKGEVERARNFYDAFRLGADSATQAIIDARLDEIDKNPVAGARKTSAVSRTAQTPAPDPRDVLAKAHAAYDSNHLERAMDLAQTAAVLPGSQTEAKILYADTIFKMGDYRRAKDFYVGLARIVPEGTELRLIERKVMAANRELGLDSNDGL